MAKTGTLIQQTAALVLALSVGQGATAENVRPDLGYCADGTIRQGWHFYCDPDAQPPQEKEEEKTARPPSAPVAAPSQPTATERMEAFNTRINELKHLAILEPTPDNLHNYMTAQAVAMRMASTFADQWQRVLFKTPELDANVRNPTSGLGGQIFQDVRAQEREAALVSAAQTKGLMFVFQGVARCAVCELQSKILGDLAARFGINVIGVSVDGSTTPEFPQPLSDSGQLKRFGIDHLPRPNLALVDPTTNEVIILGSGLLTQDVILERVYVLTKLEPGERYAGKEFLRDHGGYTLEATRPARPSVTPDAAPASQDPATLVQVGDQP